VTPRLDVINQDASASYGVDVPPCPSPSIRLQQLQELRIPQTPLTAKWPGSAVDNNEDAVQVSVFFSEACRLLTFLNRLTGRLFGG